MRGRQSRILESCRNAQSFLDDNHALLNAVNNSGARRTLDDVVAQLTLHALNQDAGRRESLGETANQHTLRTALRSSHMKAIAEVARMRLREVPNFEALRLPPGNMMGLRLAAQAGSMAEVASRHEAVFVEAGLAPEFVAQLRGATDALTSSMDAGAQGRVKRRGATEGLNAEEKRARGILRLLDALVMPKLGTNDQLIAGWRSARKIHAKPGPVPGSRVAARAETPVARPLTLTQYASSVKRHSNGVSGSDQGKERCELVDDVLGGFLHAL